MPINNNDNRKMPASNSYGSNPFWMAMSEDHSWYGVYTNVASAQDWWINKTYDGFNVTTVAAGGLGDMVFVTGDDPNEVVVNYHEVIGKPVHIPMWALGWHQSR